MTTDGRLSTKQILTTDWLGGREYRHTGREVMADRGGRLLVVYVPGTFRLAVYGRRRAEDDRRRRCWRETPSGAEREVRGDRTAGHVSRTAGADHVAAASQQLQYVVEQVAGARTPFAQVLFGQQAQSFSVHLKEFRVEPRQIEFDFGPLYERRHVFFGPNPGIGDC